MEAKALGCSNSVAAITDVPPLNVRYSAARRLNRDLVESKRPPPERLSFSAYSWNRSLFEYKCPPNICLPSPPLMAPQYALGKCPPPEHLLPPPKNKQNHQLAAYVLIPFVEHFILRFCLIDRGLLLHFEDLSLGIAQNFPAPHFAFLSLGLHFSVNSLSILHIVCLHLG